MAEPFIAEVRIWALNFAPRGWAFCNGQLLPIASNTALFSLIGTIYGGDGRQTLGLPNLKASIPMHPGHGPGLTQRRLGEKGGVPNVALTVQQIPQHNHTINARKSPALGDNDDPSASSYYAQFSGGSGYAPAANLTPMATDMCSQTGNNQAHDNLQPYLSLNFCIALVGTYPSRS